MNETALTDKYTRPALKKLRAVLLAFALLYTYGIYTSFNGYDRVILGFSVPAFYMISGFIVLREDKNREKRILRAIKRTAICFVILTAVYTLISFLLFRENTTALLTSKKFWIDFLLLNIYNSPVDSTIWYVQAMLYAYIIIFIIYKLNLLKFDIVIAAVCLVITVLTGEFASFIGFEFMGHTYIGGNFLTRALPYILIGCFIHRRKNKFTFLTTGKCWIIGVVGIAASVVEYSILYSFDKSVYSGHTLGVVLTAAAVCFYGFFISKSNFNSRTFNKMTRYELMIPYFVSAPIYGLLMKFIISKQDTPLIILNDIVGILVTSLSFFAFPIYIFLQKKIKTAKRRKKIKKEIAQKEKAQKENPEK